MITLAIYIILIELHINILKINLSIGEGLFLVDALLHDYVVVHFPEHQMKIAHQFTLI